MIENIRFMDVEAGSRFDRKGGGSEIHGPEHHSGGSEINAAGVDDAKDFGAVQGEVAPSHGHAQPRDAGEASGSGHVVEAGAGVEVMAAAGASADGGATALAPIGQDVATGANDQALRGHFISVGDSGGEVKKKMKADVTKVTRGAISC